MSIIQTVAAEPRGHRPLDGRNGDCLCLRTLRDLPRNDQRRTGHDYIHGLLTTRGRKTVRSMTGAAADEQRLNHFVSGSTWDWRVVAGRLVDEVVDQVRPQAWVLDPLIIPKTGSDTVGVETSYVSSLGQTLQVQRAYGLWAASEDHSAPTSWRLHLPDKSGVVEALGADRRDRAAPPTPAGQLGRSAADALGEFLDLLGDDPTPMVVDDPDIDPTHLIAELIRRRRPFVAHIPPQMRLTVRDRALHTHANRVMSSEEVVLASGGLRRPCRDDRLRRLRITGLSRTAVDLVGSERTRRPTGLTLIAGGAPRCSWRDDIWLTNTFDAVPEQALLLTLMGRRVRTERERVAPRVGLRDFIGRSYAGWHRHMTLTSVAHAVATLPPRGDPDWRCLPDEAALT